MHWVLVIVFPIFVRVLFLIFWRLTRTKFVFDTKHGRAWAVVTGAGNGLGLEYSKILATKGYNLILFSLLEDELAQAKQAILELLKQNDLPAVKIQTFQVDFSDTKVYDSIETFLQPILTDIAILLNNVGTDCQHCDYFDVGECEQRNEKMIAVNVVSITKMIEIVLPQMKRNRSGLVISISSGAALTVSPLLASYAATKSFIRTLMKALAVENAQYGLTFVTFLPYWISTNLTNNVQTNYFVPNAETYARHSFAKIKYGDSFESIGFWPHQITYLWTKLIGVLGGSRLEQFYLHWFMLQVKNVRKKLVKRCE